MTLRLTPVLLLAALGGTLVTGCAWEGRPDGASANHTTIDGFYEDEGALAADPVYGIGTEAEVVEPLDASEAIRPGMAAPVDLSQPAPTGGTADATSEVEEALTPGTEQ